MLYNLLAAIKGTGKGMTDPYYMPSYLSGVIEGIKAYHTFDTAEGQIHQSGNLLQNLVGENSKFPLG